MVVNLRLVAAMVGMVFMTMTSVIAATEPSLSLSDTVVTYAGR